MRFAALSRLSLALVVLAGACSDSPTGPGARLTLDEVFEEMSLSELGEGGLGLESGIPMPSVSPVPNACSYSASVQSFVCAPVTANGITVTRGYALFSASGTPQSAFDPATTASVRTTATMAGRVTMEGATTDVDMQQAMTLSGLLTSTRTLDGQQVMNLAMTWPDQGTVRMSMTMTITGLVMPDRDAGRLYPKSGTIRMAFESDAEGMGTFTIAMTFNGTSKVAVTITDGAGTEQCTIDLAATGPGASTCSSF